MNCKFSRLHNFEMLIISISELDALGDELLADEDSSYLDEAASAPAIPEGVPTDTKNKVKPFSVYILYANCTDFMLDHQSGNLKGDFKLEQVKTISIIILETLGIPGFLHWIKKRLCK